MTLADAGIQLQRTLMNGWMMRVGKGNMEALESVSGVSFTWTEPVEDNWHFSFSVRRSVGGWQKIEGDIEVPDSEADPDDEGDDIVTLVRSFGLEMLNKMATEIFPEVQNEVDDDDEE